MSTDPAGMHARQILDSRGNPTVEVDVRLVGGATGRAAVPSGASTGSREALELRDGGSAYRGKGVTRAVANVNGEIADAVRGRDAVGSAGARRGADSSWTERRASHAWAPMLCWAYRWPQLAPRPRRLASHCGDISAVMTRTLLPVPAMNVLNGGVHADNPVDFQEFMVAPVGAGSFAEALRMGAEVYQELKATLKRARAVIGRGRRGWLRAELGLERGAARAARRGDRGGRLPPRRRRCDLSRPGGERVLPRRSLRARVRGPVVVERGDDRALGRHLGALPVAVPRGRAGRGRLGRMEAAHRPRSATACSLSATTSSSPTQPSCARASSAGSRTAFLIKLNQIGTLTETLDTIALARDAGYRCVISHRSGETEDTFIADLAVATGVGQIKTGAPARSERVAKYNQLLRIEEELGDEARYAGRDNWE